VAAGDALLAPGITWRLIAEFARRPEPSPVTPAALAAQGATVTLEGADRLVAGGVTTEQVGQAAAAGGVVLHEMRFERSNLEDVFLQLTGGTGDPP